MTQSNQQTSTKYIDYLREDEPMPGQLWVCLSFLSPEGIKNCSVRGLKIRGVYGTRPEADKRAEELQKLDPDFHVFVGEMGKWLPWDPDPNDVKDQVYQEKELNDLMKGYKDNLDKSKRMQQERKEDMIRQAAKEEQAREQTREQSTKTRLRKKLEAKKQQAKIDAVASKSLENDNVLTDKESRVKELEQKLKEEDENVKAERERIIGNQKEISKTSQNIESIDSKLAKIQELYEKLNKK